MAAPVFLTSNQEYQQYFRTGLSRVTLNFQVMLGHLTKVGTPGLKALTCIESNEANAADIFLFWHAMVAAMKNVISDVANEYPTDVQEQIIGILNSRHQQVFVDGNLSSSATLYLAAVYLDPR